LILLFSYLLFSQITIFTIKIPTKNRPDYCRTVVLSVALLKIEAHSMSLPAGAEKLHSNRKRISLAAQVRSVAVKLDDDHAHGGFSFQWN
jgi:hypothetical protein